MKAKTIAFPSGKRAQAVRCQAIASGAEIAAALKLPMPRALILISGGAADMTAAETARLRVLIVDGVARVTAGEGITIIDGGTQAGIMQMIGEGRSAFGGDVPLIGVCPAALVSWPGGPSGQGQIPLEPNHTHFALTDGNRWGAETVTMFALAAFMSANAPSLAILANGGAVARDELRRNIAQGRETIVIAGSGRLADQIASVVREGAASAPDQEVAAIARGGRIALFEATDGPEALRALIRRKLFERETT